jgi:hypothetical protein
LRSVSVVEISIAVDEISIAVDEISIILVRSVSRILLYCALWLSVYCLWLNLRNSHVVLFSSLIAQIVVLVLCVLDPK